MHLVLERGKQVFLASWFPFTLLKTIGDRVSLRFQRAGRQEIHIVVPNFEDFEELDTDPLFTKQSPDNFRESCVEFCAPVVFDIVAPRCSATLS